jgi:serine/threonine protein kinase
MSQQCPKCHRVLDFPGEPVPFCPFCGSSMTGLPKTTDAADPEATLAPAAGETVEMPTRLGEYRLLRRLGHGGMGAVFEGEHEATSRRVAVKLIDAEATADALERFRQEGRLASAIDHPRCVFVFEADEDQGRPYIVLELMPGRTLEDLVQERGPMPLADALHCALDLIEGLEQVHRLGVIHRDVKPSNCFLDEEGRVKVGDFGLARSLRASTKLTRTGAFVGTPLFAAPEQVLSQPLDARADVYAVCATLYYLLTGKAPHDRGDSDYLAVLARVVSDEAPSARAHRPDLPAALDHVLARGLARDREKRWADLDELRRALASFRPARANWRVLAARFSAYVIDSALLYPVNLVLTHTFGNDPADFSLEDPSSFVPPVLVQLLTTSLLLVYYTLGDGLLRGTPGKWLLGLRTSRSDEDASPGLLRGLARTLIWLVLLLGPSSAVGFVLPKETTRQAILVGLLSVAAFVPSLACLLCTMRPRNGFRGVHEFLSGTRVAFAPERSSRPNFPCPPCMSEALPPSWPEQLGHYRLEGVVYTSGREQVLVALDPALGRHVWLWLRPADAAPVPNCRRDLFRATRLRWLSYGEHDGRRWDAFLAPRGGPIAEVIRRRGRLHWDEARPVLEQLVCELEQARAGGSLPEVLSLEQVWLASAGELQLLDRPPTAAEVRPFTPEHLVGAVSSLMLEGRVPEGAAAELPRVPLPGDARQLLRELSYFGGEEHGLGGVRQRLEEMGDRPGRVTRFYRLLHLGLLFVLMGLLGAGCWTQGLLTGPISLATLRIFLKQGERLDDRLSQEAGGLVGEVLAPTASPLARLAPAALLARDLTGLGQIREALREGAGYVKERRATFWLPLRYLHDRMPITVPREPDARVPRDLAREAPIRARMILDQPAAGYFTGLGVFMLAFFPAMCVLSALAFRGGVRFYPLGIDVVRLDGRPAGRLRCAWRALAVWALPFGLLIAARLIEDSFWKTWTPGSDLTVTTIVVPSLQLLALAVLVGSAAAAVACQERAIHDRLAGTCLVPR